MEKLIELIKLAKPETNIDDFLTATNLYEEGVIDSFDIIILIDEISAAFDIKIKAADIRRKDFMTVADIYDMIKRKGGE